MTIQKRVRLTTVLLVLSVAGGAARADRVDNFINASMIQQHIPGLSLAIVRDGKVVKAKGYGLANIETDTPAAPETVYKIASVSKQFLATGILLLVQEGKLSLTDKVSKFLEGTPESWREITIRHLLTHTSGIVREAPGFDPYKTQSDYDVIKTAFPLPLRFAPGARWEYCNVGYFILAEILHKVSGKPWDAFLAERVFAPVGMTSTRATTTEIVHGRANGYLFANGTQRNAANYLAVRPSGAFLSTVLDLARWDAALNSDTVLKSGTRDQMWTRFTLNDGKTAAYGYGWSVDTLNGRRQVHHGGSLPGFRSEFARYPEDKLTVIVLTNSDTANAERLAQGVAMLTEPALAPSSGVAPAKPPAR